MHAENLRQQAESIVITTLYAHALRTFIANQRLRYIVSFVNQLQVLPGYRLEAIALHRLQPQLESIVMSNPVSYPILE